MTDQVQMFERPTKIVVGFSGGVTSAWCAGWALRNYPREDVVLLWHDTKEEHPDTYRFLREMMCLLKDLVQIGLKRTVNPRESIDIGACECGD